MKLIAIGDNVVDCYVDQGVFYPGGNCVNVAVQSKRNGAEFVAYIGVFGTDKKAEAIKEALDSEKVSYEHSRTMIGKSGQPRVNIVDGDRVFTTSRKETVQEMVKLKLVETDLEYASTFDVCHVSVYSNMEEELSMLSERVTLSFDFSDMHEERYLEKVCPFITYAFFSGSHLNECEAKALAKSVLKKGVNVVGITKGEKGAFFFTKEGTFNRKPDYTEVLDTMGAGDSFIAGFLTEYIESNKMEKALNKAAASSARTCEHYGGIGHPYEWIEKIDPSNKPKKLIEEE